MKNVLIVTKTGHDRAATLGREISAWLRERGAQVRVLENPQDSREIPGEEPVPDLVLVLGGDGTFLSTARKTRALAVPLLGVNLGRLGFLARAGAKNWQRVAQGILDNGLEVEERMALEGEVLRNGEVAGTCWALNDIVINRGSLARLVNANISYAGEHFTFLRADGVIVSTPTGSSAYSVSAGGPLVHPGLDVFCVTPICPFHSTSGALVLPSDGELEISVEQSYGEVFVTEDGQKGMRVLEGDVVRIRRSDRGVLKVKVGKASYFQTLLEKGYTSERWNDETS